MLKLVNAVVAGLEVTYNAFGGGSTSSALQALEISHTHYWSRDLNDPHVLEMSGGGSSALSQVCVCVCVGVLLPCERDVVCGGVDCLDAIGSQLDH